MENVLELIRERRSVRCFDGSELSAAEKRALRSFSDSIENPWGRWVEFRLLDREEHVLSSPVIRGDELENMPMGLTESMGFRVSIEDGGIETPLLDSVQVPIRLDLRAIFPPF